MEKVMMLVVMLFVVMVALETVNCAKGGGGGGREVLDFINQNRKSGKGLPKGLQRKIDAWDYMVEFGYLTADPEDMTWGEFMKDLKAAQKMMAIDQSGQVDDATAEMMSKDRCGDQDQIRVGDENLTKRYTIFGAPYKKNTRHITWAVDHYSPRKTEAQVNEAIIYAYSGWANVTNLIFSPTTCGSADTLFNFTIINAGHLGIADWPQHHRIRMNTLHDLKLPPDTGAYQMGWVLAHEIGHQLGLLHSQFDGNLMRPWYNGLFVPQADDITGIQSIYGGPNDTYVGDSNLTDEQLADSCVPEWF